MSTLRKAVSIIKKLQEKGVDTEDIVIDPKAIHVVAPDDEDDETNPEED